MKHIIRASPEGRAQDALSGRSKVAIVTGASSGIGFEMVKLSSLAQQKQLPSIWKRQFRLPRSTES